MLVWKGEDGFKFANPGSMRVSLKEVLQDSASDPRNGVMMKMLAMVEYGERAGSGLQGIFKTWEAVYHCSPKLEITSSSGIDRTTLSLNFEGHQPDIEAMKQLYSGMVEIEENAELSQESKGESKNVAQKGQNDPLKEGNVALKTELDPLNSSNVASKDYLDPLNSNLEDQNDPLKSTNDLLKIYIISRIKEIPDISRVDLAKLSNISESTLKRRMKQWNIVWEGHSKTGHWILPTDNI